MFVNSMPRSAGDHAVQRVPVYRLGVGAWIAVVVAFLAPFLFYFGTAKSIVAVWNSSETFAHGYIILPISLWLIWRRRANFVVMQPTPWWPALGLVLLVGLGWLLARMGEVQVAMQYAFVAMLPVIGLAVLGRRLAWSLAFPLLFLLMAVPFGEIFIDPLISFTADFTVRALQMTGIPVLRNGTRFEIPTGSWSVVEACSGVRYLISSVTLGWLYAYLTYRSTTRRALFMLVAVLVPVVANGLRAYMIVMIGHLSSMQFAVGVDHLIYGWVFFGLVMFLMFWIGGFWRQDQPDDAVAVTASGGTLHLSDITAGKYASVTTMVLAALACTAIWPLAAHYSDRANYNPKPVRLGDIATTWAPVAAFSTWTPHFAPADATLSRVFGQPGITEPSPVALSILYYRNQRNGKAVISSTNRLVEQDSTFHVLHPVLRNETIGLNTLALRESTVSSSAGTILIWYCYWIDGQFIASNYGGKLVQAKAKLLMRGDDGSALILSAPYLGDADQARRSMRAFLGTNLPAIEAALVAAKAS